MLEASVRLTERHERIQQGNAVLHKARIIHGDTQLAQCHDHLHDALGVAVAHGRKAAVALLLLAHAVQCLGNSCRNGTLALILCQRLQCHARDIRVGYAVRLSFILRAAEETPAAVVKLAGQDAVDVLLTDAACRFGIVLAVQRDECPDGAVQSLPDGFVVVAEGLCEVVTADTSRVKAKRGQRHDDAGVLGVLLVVEDTFAVLDVLLHAGVIVLIILLRDTVAAAGKTQHGPFAADGAHLRAGRRGVNVLCRPRDGTVDRTAAHRGKGARCKRQRKCDHQQQC